MSLPVLIEEEIKSVLKSRGIKIIVEAPSEEQMKRETELMRKRKLT